MNMPSAESEVKLAILFYLIHLIISHFLFAGFKLDGLAENTWKRFLGVRFKNDRVGTSDTVMKERNSAESRQFYFGF